MIHYNMIWLERFRWYRRWQGGTWIKVQIYNKYSDNYSEYWIHNRKVNWFKSSGGRWKKGMFFPEVEIEREVYKKKKK